MVGFLLMLGLCGDTTGRVYSADPGLFSSGNRARALGHLIVSVPQPGWSLGSRFGKRALSHIPMPWKKNVASILTSGSQQDKINHDRNNPPMEKEKYSTNGTVRAGNRRDQSGGDKQQLLFLCPPTAIFCQDNKRWAAACWEGFYGRS